MNILGKLLLGKADSFFVRLPYGVCFYTLALVAIGIVNIASASRLTKPNLFLIQLLWFTIGIVFALGVAFIRTQTLKLFSYPFYLSMISLLLMVLVVGISAKGSQRWLDLGFFRLQPSEPMKLAIIFATAKFCTDYEVIGGYRLKDLIRPFNITRPFLFLLALVYLFASGKYGELIPFLEDSSSVKTLLFVLASLVVAIAWFLFSFLQIRREGLHVYQFVSLADLLLVPFILILAQPDLGTATIVSTIAFSIVLFCGLKVRSLFLAAMFGVAIAVVGWNFVLKDYQKRRVETFLNPEADIRGHGYHAAQSIIAIGSGKIIGKGFGEGTQTQLSFLPENHTDFIFSVLAEEWGFVLALLVLFLFLGLIISMLKVAARCQDRFSALLVVGACAMIFWHVTVNIGMVTGILPVVGVTLPFVSYGGASFWTNMIAIGVCLNVAIWRRA